MQHIQNNKSLMHSDDIYASLTGAASTLFAWILGWVSFGGLLEAFCLGAAGAAGGYVIKKAFDFLIKQVKNIK